MVKPRAAAGTNLIAFFQELESSIRMVQPYDPIRYPAFVPYFGLIAPWGSSDKNPIKVLPIASRIAPSVSSEGLTRSRSIREIVECETPERKESTLIDSCRRSLNTFSRPPIIAILPHSKW